jgi:hypothetical protein
MITKEKYGRIGDFSFVIMEIWGRGEPAASMG